MPEGSKVWKTIGQFSTYEEAKAKKNLLLNLNEAYEVKIKHSNLSGGFFKVKLWEPPQDNSSKNAKKNKRKKRNDNKKIRFGQQEL